MVTLDALAGVALGICQGALKTVQNFLRDLLKVDLGMTLATEQKVPRYEK